MSWVFNAMASIFEALFWRRQPLRHPQQVRPPYWTMVGVNMRSRRR